ncbi:ELL-associated factor 2-like [Pyrus ussuriensis x Pyrus communis]|uniref:ELL-associated factor 2-like n=1 Tax=Pyrus ussuriensis x Pyrus communis TaxID=2448454 RepID=A0A5N5GXD8_9ROSA|nr:ELL-associated factor 2 [Pyrus x bretschneideri]KAB2619988.1 ELL-associated factor 2-like [Pyrus ussuriensis x Pyrus communis]
MADNSKEEPKTGPQSNRWYNLTLGPSFRDGSANKYCTLRYDFKPASIDKTKAGALKKTKDNRVTVEFQNNQVGKPNVTFKGSSEEYKGNDAVLFFDGQTFRLERLHRSVKQLRHDRRPGESAAGMAVDPQLSPVGKAPKLTHQYNPARTAFPVVPVEVERIDVGVPENPGAKAANKGVIDYSSDQPNVSAASPGPKNEEVNDEHQDIDIEDLFGSLSPDDGNAAEDEANPEFDIIMPHQNDSDNEIADVDDSGDEVDKGPNAAEALRAQVMNAQGRETHTDMFGDEGNAEGRKTETSSSSSSSGSSSGSGSSSSGSSSGSSSSSGSENGGNNAGSDDDSVNSI